MMSADRIAPGAAGPAASPTRSDPRALGTDTALRLAAIDIGTVSTRLLCATVEHGELQQDIKQTAITDLGAGVDATGQFAADAVARVLDACAQFRAQIVAHRSVRVCTTLTSAARDVANGDVLLDGLRKLGLRPQVIAGTTEARLTFYGVAHDFADERIAVADLGGGSTELTVGSAALRAHASVELERVASLDIGCRRATERFFSTIPPRPDELAAMMAWAHELYEPYWRGLERRPDRLVAVGGTVTTLVALVHELAAYDSSFVHLRELPLDQVEACMQRMRTLDVAGIAALPGVQAKRAGVLLAGAAALYELMRSGGYDRLTVSENSLLAGAIATMSEALDAGTTAIGWVPELSS